MLLSTTETIHGKTIVKHLGLVRGNTIRARHVGRDILALLRNLVGGEISDYTKAIAEAREQAIDRMVEEAESLGARLELARVYFEIGKRLREPQSKHRKLNGLGAEAYLEQAGTLFEEMNLHWDLDKLSLLTRG